MELAINRKSPVFAAGDFNQILGATYGATHRLIWLLSYLTASRIIDVLRLPVSCVYGTNGEPLKSIRYPSEISENEEDRSVPSSPKLIRFLSRYSYDESNFYLFPGVKSEVHLQTQSANDALSRALSIADLEHCGYTTDSFRRSAIIKMLSEGVNVSVIVIVHRGNELSKSPKI